MNERLIDKIEYVLVSSIPEVEKRREMAILIAGIVLGETIPIKHVLGKSRVLYKDPDDGFSVRRASYRKEYRRYNKGNRVKSRSANDYSVLDFLVEEWGDLIEKKELRSNMIISEDFSLYVALRTYAYGLRKGTFGRESRPDAAIEDFLGTKHTSIRQKPPWF